MPFGLEAKFGLNIKIAFTCLLNEPILYTII